ncbi:TetR/AcrR family transcriptional regulator [Arthrobacter castelli]|uniref:TetR/AcrR family transcriptional regulator n=1 Tax=Arthrobacter castelli TaxID=271431 RepID=UPI000425F490|nr:TetR/AcrR family transcriptional regulator [Arthrobacter castelli]
MTEKRNIDTRHRLLEAAAGLIAAAPGKDVPLRTICEKAGVKLPTLYHFFGSKDGLLDAVIEHGFDLYMGVKGSHESSGDPIQDIRDGWDAHVAFGLANPGFYALMYGQVAPGSRPAAQERPTKVLKELAIKAEQQGLLVVTADQATAHILAANIGVTLRQMTNDAPDPSLSGAAREATIAAITGTHPLTGTDDRAEAASVLLSKLANGPSELPEPEMALLRHWLIRLARPQSGTSA